MRRTPTVAEQLCLPLADGAGDRDGSRPKPTRTSVYTPCTRASGSCTRPRGDTSSPQRSNVDPLRAVPGRLVVAGASRGAGADRLHERLPALVMPGLGSDVSAAYRFPRLGVDRTTQSSARLGTPA